MQQILIIEAGRADNVYWRDLWRYRELLFALAWRDLSIRYKETLFGILWALIRPLLTMLIFTVIFRGLSRLPSDGDVPYPLMVLAGMVVWTLFSTSWNEAGSSLIREASLITKIYFPRLIVPMAAAAVNFVDFMISFLLLMAMMLWYRFIPGWQIALAPIFVSFVFLANLGPSFLIAALNVRYRDLRYVVPFVIQLGMYVSPVGFSSNVVPGGWRWVYSLNPVVGVIDGFRWCVLGGQGGVFLPGLLWSVAATAACLWLGVRQFRLTEKRFADLL